MDWESQRYQPYVPNAEDSERKKSREYEPTIRRYFVKHSVEAGYGRRRARRVARRVAREISAHLSVSQIKEAGLDFSEIVSEP